jgi:hypothetical protein
VAAPGDAAGMLLGLVRVAVLRAPVVSANFFALFFLSRCVTARLSRCVTARLSRCVTARLSRCVTAREPGAFFPAGAPADVVAVLVDVLPWRVAAPRASVRAAGFRAAGLVMELAV